jgi:hypothetical protein
VTFAGFVRDRPAVAPGTARADVLPLQADRLHRLPTTALARVALAALARAVRATPAENSVPLFNGQHVHCSKIRTASALSRTAGKEVALAVVLAIADIISLGFVSRDNQSDCGEHESEADNSDNTLFIAAPGLMN